MRIRSRPCGRFTDARAAPHSGRFLARIAEIAEGRIGEGKNAGVRNNPASIRNAPGGANTQRSETSDQKRIACKRDPDVRVGAKGVMHLDIGESVCLQEGNNC